MNLRRKRGVGTPVATSFSRMVCCLPGNTRVIPTTRSPKRSRFTSGKRACVCGQDVHREDSADRVCSHCRYLRKGGVAGVAEFQLEVMSAHGEWKLGDTLNLKVSPTMVA